METKSLVIPANLFELTSEQAELSKLIYNGKIIRCLVAPYHSLVELQDLIPQRWNTYMFPEHALSYEETRCFINRIASPFNEVPEVNIVTTSLPIITDMIGGCVRILERDRIVDCPIRTLLANIHEVRSEVLEYVPLVKRPNLLEVESAIGPFANAKITELIDRINSKEPATQVEFDVIKKQIDLVGEKIIRYKLREQLQGFVSIKDI